MTRQANPNVKDNIHVRARDESEEQKFSDLKKLAIQDEVELVELVLEGIDAVFKNHHWPPGNPQLPLSIFQTQLTLQQQQQRQIENCKCGRPAVIYATDLQSVAKVEQRFCKSCFSQVPLRHDPKVWKITIDRRNNKL
jgi:hypothetical protein